MEIENKQNSSSQAWFTGLAGAGLVLGIVVLVNVLASGVNGIRADLTSEKLYTLSDGASQMCGAMERPVSLKLYYSRSSREMPVVLKQYAQRITDLLYEFESAGKGRITLEIHDPRPDSDEEEWAQKYGLVGQVTGMVGGDQLYLGLVAVSGAKEAAIPLLRPEMEPQLEYLITRLVSEVTRDSKRKLGVISSFPLMGTPAPMMGAPQSQRKEKWLLMQELESQYELQVITSSATEIPGDLDALLIVHPGKMDPGLAFAIDQYLLSGGRILAFLDPLSLAERDINPETAQFNFMQGGSDLNALSSAWGVDFTADKLAADPTAASQLSNGRGGVEESVNWLTLRSTSFNSREPAMSGLEVLSFPFGGSFNIRPLDGIEAVPLLTLSPKSGSVDQYLAMGGASAVMRDLKPAGTGLVVAVRLTGTFPTAFPQGAPAAPEGSAPTPPKEGLQKSEKPGTVILIGDADMVYDQFAVQVLNYFGQRYAQPMNDNFSFALNLIEQVTGSEALIGLRSRGTFRRPFEKVEKMAMDARARYYEQEQALIEKVRAAEQRLAELQSAKKGDQKFLLSAEQRQEIKNIQEEQFRFQKELKDVRRNLRQEIDSLGLKVKAFNMAVIPLAVVAFGVAQGLRRRRRSSL